MRHWTRKRGLAISLSFTIVTVAAVGIGWPQGIVASLVICIVLTLFILGNCRGEAAP